MNNSYDKDIRKNKPQKISETLGKITKNLTSRFGKNEFIIHSKWNEMVGDFFAEYSEPLKLDNMNNYDKKNEEFHKEGILHVNIEGPAALDFQHLKDKIIDKINSFFGYKAVSKIVIHQIPYIKKVQKPLKISRSNKKLNKEQKLKLKKVTSGISSNSLEKALLKLGESIIIDKD